MLFKASPNWALWGREESQTHTGWLHLVAAWYHLPQFWAPQRESTENLTGLATY